MNAIIPTSGDQVEAFIDWMRKELQKTPYGEIGLLFTLHNSGIVGVDKISKKKNKLEKREP